MPESSRPAGDERSVWENDIASGQQPAIPAQDEPETYPIPGGMGGWSPADLPVGGTTVTKTPPRNEPRPKGPRIGGKRVVKSDWLALAGFNLLVFLSSVCVMTLELTASRLIARHVGSSLYTWTSVIGVVLAGITIGNYLGGWLADRFHRGRTLSLMYLFGSFSCASVLLFDQVAGNMTRPEGFSWPMWVLCIVAMIFLLPALMLGTTSPLVASMALARSTKTGMTVGNVYAWGAFGSIVGTFLTGFYLIDMWGTRSIVGLTALVLALLAVCVAGTHWVFRTAVVFGWLQLLAWSVMLATVTKQTGFVSGEYLGEWLTWHRVAPPKDDEEAARRKQEREAVPKDAKDAARVAKQREADDKAFAKITEWKYFGGNVAGKLHELGLLLKLRDDVPGQYYDESSYSYIHVGDDYTDGSQVRYLRLDKLIHAYYEPDNPTALHYEYEQVYAAVTKATAPGPTGGVSIQVPDFPDRQYIVARLPARVTFDAGTQTLRIEKFTGLLASELQKLSSDAHYWSAVEQLNKLTTAPDWGGFSTAPLSELPEGVVIPPYLSRVVRHDAALEVMTAYEAITADTREKLIALSPQAPWRKTIQSLTKQNAPMSALFLGGGGFVFPRWVAAEFPGATRIDVAELDPAVHHVVQTELGLGKEDEKRITTTIGDARNFVEDRVQENRRLKAAGQQPVLYDFIYGDAFNDFSVPFHLATLEFDRKVQELLSPGGVFQQNIIDIYPRTEAPGGQVGEATVEYGGEIPADALEVGQTLHPKFRKQFAPLELIIEPGRVPKLHTKTAISLELESELVRLALDNTGWTKSIHTLAEASQKKRMLPAALPKVLTPEHDLEHDWTPCPEPFGGVETYRDGQDSYALGFRGAVSKELQQRLIDLAPKDAAWKDAIIAGAKASHTAKPGRFLARYVQSVAKVFPCIYVFSTSHSQPGDDRDTFVVVCSQRPLDLDHVEDTGLWKGKPFATFETRAGITTLGGHMDSLLEHSGRIALTDDYAPVDNLLKPVFALQD